VPASVVRFALVPLLVPFALSAERGPANRPPPRAAPADEYLGRYAEIRALAADRNQVARVDGLVLDRDVGHFRLEQGTITLLTPVDGETVAAIFHGRGVFSFSPPTRIEKERLIRFEKRDSLADEFTDLMLLFTDTTLAELRARLSFAPGPAMMTAPAAIKTALGYLGDEGRKSFDPDLMGDFLNGTRSGQFTAYINRERYGSLLFAVNPGESEAVRLWGMKLHGFYSRDAEIITQFAARGFSAEPGDEAERVNRVEVKDYAIDVWLPQNGGGGLSFSAAAHLRLIPRHWNGPWVPFYLFDELILDSARVDQGPLLPVFKGKEDNLAWIRLPRPLEPDANPGVTLYYHGDLIRRFGDFFYLGASVTWYPLSLEYRALATFDLTFHNPDWLQLASVGQRTDSSDARHMTTTHWVMAKPIRNASFNLGKFQAFRGEDPGVVSVTVLVSEEAHRSIDGLGSHQRHMKEKVGNDVTSALHFFNHVYGPSQVDDFTATETPLPEGEAFPGLIDLSWATFQHTDNLGGDQIFRAHEVAHQWWGIGVDYATYHDRWLSEGFSDFSGLWYLQSVQKNNQRYYETLDRWRSDIMFHRGDRSPISLGHRTRSSKDENGYQILVYRKGAWVLHMLRGLLLDLDTMNEDRFTGMMKQFFADHVGRRASTRDFQAAVERAWDGPMDWFFDEWIDDYRVPTYRVATRIRSEDGGWQVGLKVRQSNVPDAFLMYIPVSVDLPDGVTRRFRIKVTGPETVVDLPPFQIRPSKVTFNDLDGVLAEVKPASW
jgi:hypothetical protein